MLISNARGHLMLFSEFAYKDSRSYFLDSKPVDRVERFVNKIFTLKRTSFSGSETVPVIVRMMSQ